MNLPLLEQLLHEEESSSLDFKREPYKLDSEDEGVKSEFLKDILSFANAWRRSDAYILIGVEEVKGGRSSILGIQKHFDDASLQQFINGKTQRPIEFSYEAFSIEEKHIGIIRIPPQKRPFFCKKQYGKVKAKEVYIRRGSSTAIADPDEVMSMGEALSGNEMESPDLELQFCHIRTREELGLNLSLRSEFLEPMEPPQELSHPFGLAVPLIVDLKNPNYEKELINHVASIFPFTKIGLMVKNASPFPALDVRVEIIFMKDDALVLLDETEFPDPPSKSPNFMRSPLIHNPSPRVTVRNFTDRWELIAEFGKIQPQARNWSEDTFYIAATRPNEVDLNAHIFADNLPTPLIVPIHFQFTTPKRQMVSADLEGFRSNN